MSTFFNVTLTVLCSFQEPLSFSLFLLQTRKLAGPRLASPHFTCYTGADLGGGCKGCAPPLTCGFLIQLVFCQKKKRTMWFIGVEVDKRRLNPLLKKILDPPLLQRSFRQKIKYRIVSPILLPYKLSISIYKNANKNISMYAWNKSICLSPWLFIVIWSSWSFQTRLESQWNYYEVTLHFKSNSLSTENGRTSGLFSFMTTSFQNFSIMI